MKWRTQHQMLKSQHTSNVEKREKIAASGTTSGTELEQSNQVW